MNIKEAIKEKTVIHCETEEESERILGMAHELGYKWADSESYVGDTRWDVEKSKTYYYLFKGTYGNHDYIKERNYTIIPSTQIADLKYIEELKIKALLEGLEAENIEEFMGKAKISDYRNYGKAYVSAARNKINEQKPLFITDDVVELFSDIVTLYAVDLNNQGIESPEWDFKECEKMGLKIFYYKKNADKYIEENRPKPLFITEDSTSVFDKDEYYSIGVDFKAIRMRALEHGRPYSSDVKRFKHESNADEYVWKNKRVFSYEDIIEHAYNSPKYRSFIEKLAKERAGYER